MNPSVITQFGSADPNASPLTINELIQLLNTLVSSNISPEYPDPAHPTYRLFYVVSDHEPGSDDHDKLWIQTDTTGKPMQVNFFFGGRWRRIPNGMVGEIRGFTGAPGYDSAWPPAVFNASGKGNIGGPYDGWAICNGGNGTPDLSDKFLIGAHMNKHNGHPAYDAAKGGWVTFVPGEGTDPGQEVGHGGDVSEMIAMVNLPPLDNSVPDPVTGALPPVGLYITGKEAKLDTPSHDASALVDTHYANAQPQNSVLLTKYGADPRANPPQPQRKLPIMPPYYALAWITFIGY